jgi:protein-tyrosine-phosphatase
MAEYLLKNWLQKNNRYDIEVFSCGTNATSDISSFCMAHIDKLNKMGIDTSKHQRTQLSEDILAQSDIVIAMDESHRNWIREKFNKEIKLYNEIYKNEKTSIRITQPGSTGMMSDTLLDTLDYLNKSLPDLVSAIDKLKMNI